MNSNEKLLRQITAVWFSAVCVLGTIALYQRYDAWLVTAFIVFLIVIWFWSGKTE